jgi:hypothetical protein
MGEMPPLTSVLSLILPETGWRETIFVVADDNNVSGVKDESTSSQHSATTHHGNFGFAVSVVVVVVIAVIFAANIVDVDAVVFGEVETKKGRYK